MLLFMMKSFKLFVFDRKWSKICSDEALFAINNGCYE